MEVFDEKVIKVNGPINVVRLEGVINDIKKVIYVFMDQHYDIHEQAQCENIYSKDIQEYLAENFTRLNTQDKKYDFFLEIHPKSLENVKFGNTYESIVNNRNIYIVEVAKLFRKILKFDTDTNKISISPFIKNLRLHYMDIRDYFQNQYVYALMDNLRILGNFKSNEMIILDSLSTILNNVERVSEHCSDIRNNIEKVKTGIDIKKISVVKMKKKDVEMSNKSFEEIKAEDTNDMAYLIDKIYNSYKHENVKRIIETEVDAMIKRMDNIVEMCTNIFKEFDEIGSVIYHTNDRLIKDLNDMNKYSYGVSLATIGNMSNDMFNHMHKLFMTFIQNFALFMDIYFLRRFTDKDYISNAITYTGSAHSSFYIDFLVKKFDFKVTHFSYSAIKDLRELNAEIKKIDDVKELALLFYPPIRSQCSDLTHFPENFS